MRKMAEPKEEQMNHCGIAEVYAYLGLWVRTAGEHANGESHIHLYRQHVKALHEYAQERRWLA